MDAQRKQQLDKEAHAFGLWTKMLWEGIEVNHRALRANTGELSDEEKRYLAVNILLNIDALTPAQRNEIIARLPQKFAPAPQFALATLLEGILA